MLIGILMMLIGFGAGLVLAHYLVAKEHAMLGDLREEIMNLITRLANKV